MKRHILVSALAATALLSNCTAQQAPAPNHLIILTEADSGNADASFMTVDTLEECETRAATAMKVFPAAGIKYIAHYCTYSATSFEPFGHNPEPTGPQYIFGLDFSRDGKTLQKVTRYTNIADCKKVEQKSRPKTCVISYQNML